MLCCKRNGGKCIFMKLKLAIATTRTVDDVVGELAPEKQMVREQ